MKEIIDELRKLIEAGAEKAQLITTLDKLASEVEKSAAERMKAAAIPEEADARKALDSFRRDHGKERKTWSPPNDPVVPQPATYEGMFKQKG